MRHVPHLYLPGPWPSGRILVPTVEVRHLERVLRMSSGPVSYTDGDGLLGSGTYSAGEVERGDERRVAEPHPWVTLAVAPPKSSDRQRFIVEKAAELGVRRVVWLETRHTEGRAPLVSKACAWAVSALEQSRGAHVMTVEEATPLTTFDPQGDVVVCDPSGERLAALGETVTVLIGPEGGFSPDELQSRWRKVTLGARILRTETASLVAAGILLAGPGPGD